jgi:hypothetical protein
MPSLIIEKGYFAKGGKEVANISQKQKRPRDLFT